MHWQCANDIFGTMFCCDDDYAPLQWKCFLYGKAIIVSLHGIAIFTQTNWNGIYPLIVHTLVLLALLV